MVCKVSKTNRVDHTTWFLVNILTSGLRRSLSSDVVNTTDSEVRGTVRVVLASRILRQCPGAFARERTTRIHGVRVCVWERKKQHRQHRLVLAMDYVAFLVLHVCPKDASLLDKTIFWCNRASCVVIVNC